MLTNFQAYPFEKLNDLLKNISPDSEKSSINLTIGEPQFPTPRAILDTLIQNAHLLNKYPNSKGEDYLKNAQIDFVQKRFGATLSQNQIIPTFGTREVLFNFPQFYLFSESKFSNCAQDSQKSAPDSQNPKQPTIAYPNPFYQIYEGAAIASCAKSILMPLDSENDFKPKLTQAQMQEADIVILNSPNNPTGATLSLDEMCEWVQNALKYDFVILSDECYSEIYENSAPAGILQACVKVGNTEFKNVLALNSISKRSSAPGLRSGFIAGDAQILKNYAKYRTYIGCALPLPLQKAAATAWSDFADSEISRKIYAQNLKLAREILGIEISPYTFYAWLKVADDLEFTKTLFERENIKVLPGRFLGRNDAGQGFVRLALVYESDIVKHALETIKKYL